MTEWLRSIAFILYLAITVMAVMAYGTVHQPTIIAFYLLSCILVCLFAVSAAMPSDLDERQSILVPLLLFGVYALIQAVPLWDVRDPGSVELVTRSISLEPFHSLDAGVRILVLYFITAVFIALLDSRRRLINYVIFLSVFGTGYAFFAIIQSLLSPDAIYGIYTPASGTPFGSFVNRHNFAAIMEMAIAFPAGLLFTGAVGRDKYLLLILAIAIMATALLLSGSRGGTVSTAALLIFIALISSKGTGARGLAVKLILLAALIITAVAGSVFVGGETSLARFGDSARSEDMSSKRTEIWSVTLRVIRENLPLGAGIGAFKTAYAQHDTEAGTLAVEQAHNDYLQAIADAGVVGFALGAAFLAMFASYVRKGIREKDDLVRGIAVGAAGACFGVLIHSAFDFVLHITAVAVVFLSCLAVLVSAVGRSGEAVKGQMRPAPHAAKFGRAAT